MLPYVCWLVASKQTGTVWWNHAIADRQGFCGQTPISSNRQKEWAFNLCNIIDAYRIYRSVAPNCAAYTYICLPIFQQHQTSTGFIFGSLLFCHQVSFPAVQSSGVIGFHPNLQVRAAPLAETVHPAYGVSLADDWIWYFAEYPAYLQTAAFAALQPSA